MVLDDTDMVSSNLFFLILVPRFQVCNVCVQLCEYCHSQVTVRHTSESLGQLASEAPPTILIATPKSLLVYLSTKQAVEAKSGKKSFWRNRSAAGNDLKTTFKTNLRMIVLDEADAMMTLGFEQDLESLLKDILGSRSVEHRYQAVLCSATLSAGVSKSLSPVVD